MIVVADNGLEVAANVQSKACNTDGKLVVAILVEFLIPGIVWKNFRL